MKQVQDKETKEYKGIYLENYKDVLTEKEKGLYEPYIKQGFIPYIDTIDKAIGLVSPDYFEIVENDANN